MKSGLTRRQLIKAGALVVAGSVVAACQPKVVEKIVEKEVTKIVQEIVKEVVKETVMVAGTPQVVEKEITKIVEKVVQVPVEEEIVLTYTSWGEVEQPGNPPDQFEKFFADHPNIKIEAYGYPNYDEKLYLLMASGTMPDFFRTQDEPFVKNAARGIYKNLDALVDRDSAFFNKDDFYPGAWESFRYDPDTGVYGQGAQFCIPNTGGCLLWLVNKEVFADAGVDVPEENGLNWTLDDFVEIGLQIRELDAQERMTKGYYSWPGTVYNMPLIWTHGGEYLNEDYSKCLLGEPESIKAHEWLYRIMHEWRLCPLAGGGEMTGMSWDELIISKKLAMQMGGPWNRLPLTDCEIEGFQEVWDIVHVPKNPDTGKRATRTSWDGSAISPQTEYVDESWTAVKFMADDWFIEQTLKAGAHGSSRISTAEGRYFEGNKETPQHEEVFGQALREYSHLQPITKFWGEMWDIIAYYYDNMFNPELKMPPAEACPEMAWHVNYLFENEEISPKFGA